MDTQGGGAEPWETAAALVRATRHGDALALDELLTLVTPVRDPAVLADRTHRSGRRRKESLVAVFKGVRTLRDPLAFYDWVPTVTVREAVRVATRTEPADVRDVLARLPVRHRAVLVLRELYSATCIRVPLMSSRRCSARMSPGIGRLDTTTVCDATP
ncbi:hypothetical protein ACWD5V_02835 [Streptomyces sp. NPDC002523]